MSRPLRLVFGAAVLAGLLTGCGGSSSGGGEAAASQTITGSVTFAGIPQRGYGSAFKGKPCVAGMGVPADVADGADVTVEDEHSTVIGHATLGAGTFAADGSEKYTGDPLDNSIGPCQETFSASVPDDATFYKVTVGKQPPKTYSHDDLAGNGWRVELTIR